MCISVVHDAAGRLASSGGRITCDVCAPKFGCLLSQQFLPPIAPPSIDDLPHLPQLTPLSSSP